MNIRNTQKKQDQHAASHGAPEDQESVAPKEGGEPVALEAGPTGLRKATSFTHDAVTKRLESLGFTRGKASARYALQLWDGSEVVVSGHAGLGSPSEAGGMHADRFSGKPWNEGEKLLDATEQIPGNPAEEIVRAFERIEGWLREQKGGGENQAQTAPGHDWEAIKQKIVPWKVFERYTMDEMSAANTVKGLKEGFEEVVGDLGPWITSNGKEAAESALVEHGLDPEEIEEQFPEQFEELCLAGEAARIFNIHDIAPGRLFIRMDDEIELQGMFSGDDEAREKFRVLAEQHGFTRQQADEVIQNASYGGMGGVGVIAPGCAVVEDALKGDHSARGKAILYCTDPVNGSGHYLMSREPFTLKVKSLADAIDHGSYSLGSVFGTDQWSY